MKHIRVFESFDSAEKIKKIVDFIQPSNPMDSDEYYYYIWADDEAYYEFDKLKVSDFMKVIEETVFKPESNTSKKFGWDFLDANKVEILKSCEEDLISDGINK